MGIGAWPQQAPAGCEALFAATSKGGASWAPPRGGGFCARGPALEEATVFRAVDGDTIILSNGQRVRYIGVNAPESTTRLEPFGPEASQFNHRLVAGKRVRLEKDRSERDRFGRLLRYVYVDGLMANAELVREGYARARAYAPDTKYQPCLQALEAEARAHSRGLWALGR